MIELLHGNCYELIKQISDKSIDLVIIDPPYEFDGGGGGGAFGSENRDYHKQYLDLYVDTDDKYYREYQKNKKAGNEIEAEKNRIIYNSRRLGKSVSNLSRGINTKILDELERVMKKTNIYMV